MRSMDPRPLASVESRFRSLAAAIVPEAASLDEAGWREALAIVEGALAPRPEGMRRQLRLLIRVLHALPVLRYGRTFDRLDSRRKTAFLEWVQDAPVLLLRRGFWGLRTLALMGYWARPAAAREIGYRATAAGWSARR